MMLLFYCWLLFAARMTVKVFPYWDYRHRIRDRQEVRYGAKPDWVVGQIVVEMHPDCGVRPTGSALHPISFPEHSA